MNKYQKLLTFIFIFILLFLFFNQKVFAYGTETHAALTQEIFNFYNQHFPQNKIPEALKDYLIDGSRREDSIPRFFNHFYDPVYDRGLNDLVWGRGYASKIWAQDPSKQNQVVYKVASTIASILSAFQQKKLNLISTESDFTWQRAIEYYLNGEPEKAMFALGHILHLIEDASVPAHTRNDGHPAVLGDEDPYEVWAYRFNRDNIRESIEKFLKNKQPIILDSLDSYFNSMASYSNNNFYSGDTIGIQSGYDKPQPDYITKDGDYFYGFKIDREFGDYRIFLKEKQGLFNTLISTTDNISLFVNKEGGDKVLKDYWQRLSVKAIQHGAGVINLFFQEVEKTRANLQTAQTVQRQKSFLGQFVDSGNSLINKIFRTDNLPDSVIKLEDRNVSDFESQLIDVNKQTQQKINRCGFNTNQSPLRTSLVINEVAWMGSVDNPNAEWIELKNISGKTLDISGYQIIDKGEKILIVLPEEVVIPAGGFYLLERISDETVSMIKADLIYQGALSNTNEGLRLFNKDCILLDEVFADPNWPAGDNNTKQTMERSVSLDWHTSINSGGTPKAENSKPVIKNENLIESPEEQLFITSSFTTTTTSSKIQQNQNFQIQNQTQTSSCSYETFKTPLFQKLIINELAWMGSISSANAEWIELKNISGSSLDISDYWLLDKGEQIKIKFDKGTVIPAGGFYLLERNSDDTVEGVKADKIYSGALSNTNDGLRLFDNQCNLLDEVLANPNWPAGDNNTKRTMERRADLGWQTSFNVGGTPKAVNSSGFIYSSSGGGVIVNNTNNNQSFPAKILISEVQITGGPGKTNNDFIELYNPNDTSVNLKGYRLVKRTKTGISDSLIKSWTEDSYIPAKGFYLWVNSDYVELADLADVTTNATISDNNGVAIRFGANDSGIIIDSVAWGEAQNVFVEGSVFPINPVVNQSIQRKFQNDTFVDTDNNANDFEIQTCPSPRAQFSFCKDIQASTSKVGADHIVISEIMAGSIGNANSEWIELYNPTEQTFDLSGWSLKRRATSTATTESNLVSSVSFAGLIKPRSFFLIASQFYEGDKNPDLFYSQLSNHLAQDEDVLLLYDDKGNLIDEVSYVSIDFGKSLERKVYLEGVCVSAQNDGEFLGNNCDTDSVNDFEIRDFPNPQNSQNLPEPRQRPTTVSNFKINYHFDVPVLEMSWDDSYDVFGSTTTISYQVEEINSSSSSPIDFITSSTQKELRIYEIGRYYDFSIKAVDKEGLSSVPTFASIYVPSFINSLYFYRHPDSSSNLYLVDIYYDSYPFIPNLYKESFYPYRLIVFYNNEDQIVSRINYEDYQPFNYYNFQTIVPGSIVMRYHPCYSSDLNQRFESLSSVILLPTKEVSQSDCYAGWHSDALNPLQLEDNHLQLALASSTDDVVFDSSQFLIVAFYDRYPWNFGLREFELVAYDKTKYYFQNNPPPQQAPTQPQNLQVVSYTVNSPTSTVEISWIKSTDTDTIDDFLFYEFSLDGGLSWQILTNYNVDRAQLFLPLGNTYYVLIRAVDDFGNVSQPTGVIFSLPEPVIDTTSRSNNWFAVDSARVENGILKIKWRLLNNPAAAVFGIFPFVSELGLYNNESSVLHKDYNGNEFYPYLTANSSFQCNTRITPFSDYYLGWQYETHFSSVSGISANELIGREISFALYINAMRDTGPACYLAGEPLFIGESIVVSSP